MVFTHVLVGILLGAIAAGALPGATAVAVTAGGLGGFFPDLDMLFVHRKTLHFPVVFSLLALVTGGIAALEPAPVTLAAFVFLLAASLHSLMDTLGGGKEMRPWRETDDRAVYDHVSGRWLTPRRLIYDGSLPDLGMAVVAGGFAVYLLPGGYTLPVLALLFVAGIYTVLRRWITRVISEEFDTFSEYIQYRLRSVFGRFTG
ncbi:metal-dependent hydrolase [Haloglomus litoreum]|uniref:metal-dependent hydrolase n=1 Tax=Haloglomus litoreum TaxID=3034026 RepID=UPI0023E8B9DD|nr:metal-dependent hydrolase [Haloglomus sp. DT116]